ncbi:eukaryotic translation initiation factor eIF2A-domain-containing protein [Flammula alnicola]|nr:eukaryotic translation initiation factor eIF2A-domain-containing protein [Flammula alnicola]
MASKISQQYAFRAQKSLGLVNGTPDYTAVAGFVAPDVPARTQTYSNDGRLYAYALPTVVRIYQAEGAQLLQELPLSNIVDFSFSPRGTYISTWERPARRWLQHKNLRVFSVSTGEELIAFTQKSQEGWELQYTISESHAIRLVSSEIQVFRPSEWSKGIVDKLKVEGSTAVSLSPGLNPSVAVFVAEKKGAPASIKIYGLSALNSPPTCQKTFFKADRAQIKWNTLGTQVLLLTQTEVDNSNKSYYGETGMYLLITLDKEGPIHDFAWSPNSKEFGVVYGYMPAKTMLFDQRVRTLHDFGSSPYNFISFNPQGRLIALAGFGNLAGKIDVFDRRNLSKVCTIDAPNTSYCEWSPDGRFLLTATLSPRLRVDNGIKIWHCSGPLMHAQLTDELYQTAWRPTPVENVPPFGQTIPPAPAPSESVQSLAAALKPVAAKPAGAYRPPGARGLATPSIFKREDEGGPMMNGGNSGSATPPRYNRSPANGNAGRRQVPGAPSSPSPGPDNQKGNRKRKGKKEGGASTPGGPGDDGAEGRQSLDVPAGGNENGARQDGRGDVRGQGQGRGPRQDREQQQDGRGGGNRNERNGRKVNGAGGIVNVPPPPRALDAVAKKARNLNKKLKAIDELKEKAKRGERLEATQLRKIDGEAEIRKELAALGI